MEIFSRITAAVPVALPEAFGFLNVVGDFLILLVLFGLLFVFLWYMGKGPFIGLLIALYVAYALFSIFPYKESLPVEPQLLAVGSASSIFLLLMGIAYVVLRRTVASDFIYIGILGQVILCVLGAGLLLAIAFHVLAIPTIYAFSPILHTLFAPPELFFWWFAAPLVGLFFLSR